VKEKLAESDALGEEDGSDEDDDEDLRKENEEKPANGTTEKEMNGHVAGECLFLC